MILLDTNIVSEMMRPVPTKAVVEWLNEQDTASLFLATITIAEIGYGLRILPPGKRRQTLETGFERILHSGFEQRICSFDEAAAHLYPEIMSVRRARGRPMDIADGQIAAIARANSLALATRNIRDFEGCGLALLNPFELDS